MKKETQPYEKRSSSPRAERANPDRQVRAYAFPARIVGELPDWVEPVAEEMRARWNGLAGELKRAVAPFREQEDAIASLPKSEQKAAYQALKVRTAAIRPWKDLRTVRQSVVAGEDSMPCAEFYALAIAPFIEEEKAIKDLPDDEQTAARKKIADARADVIRQADIRTTQKPKLTLPSTLYYSIADRFMVTMAEWPQRRKRAKKPFFTKGMPRIQYEPTDTNLPIVIARNKGDEVEFESLYDGAIKGFTILRQPDESGINVTFAVASVRGQRPLEPIRLRVAFDRLPPSDAHVKRINLVRRKGIGGPEWKLIFTCDVVARERDNRTPTGRVAGYNAIGWRLLDDEHGRRVRIGMIADNGGNFYEITIPWEIGGRHARRNRRFLERKGDVYVTDWTQKFDLDSEIGQRVQKCKDNLVVQFAEEGHLWPTEAREMMRFIDKMRDAGLYRLMELLRGTNTEGFLTLSMWDEEVKALRREAAVFDRMANNCKKAAFEKLAHWLTVNFDRIAATNADLKDLAEAEDQAHGLKRSQQRRQVAGQFRLKEKLRHAAERRGVELIPLEDEYVCYCGAKLDRSGKLLIACEKGHLRDQDAAASAWALSQLQTPASTSLQPLEIPTDLRRYVRLMAANEVAVMVTAGR